MRRYAISFRLRSPGKLDYETETLIIDAYDLNEAVYQGVVHFVGRGYTTENLKAIDARPAETEELTS